MTNAKKDVHSGNWGIFIPARDQLLAVGKLEFPFSEKTITAEILLQGRRGSEAYTARSKLSASTKQFEKFGGPLGERVFITIDY